MSKFGSFGAYPERSLFSAEAALLTAWPSLVRYHDDIVLVGGLAIHYLTRRDTSGLPGAVTIDVDFAISLGASGGQYGTIKSDLQGLGFVSESRRLGFCNQTSIGPRVRQARQRCLFEAISIGVIDPARQAQPGTSSHKRSA